MNWYKTARFEDYNDRVQADISEAAKKYSKNVSTLEFEDDFDLKEEYLLNSATEEILQKYYPTLKGRERKKLFDEFRNMIYDKYLDLL